MNLAELPAMLRRWLEPKPAVSGSPEQRAAIATAAEQARQHLRAGRSAADQGLTGAAATLYGIALARLAEATPATDPDRELAKPGAAATFAASPAAASAAGKDALGILER